MRTIRQQLIRRLLVSFGLLLVCGTAGIYLSTRAALLEEFDQALRAKANTVISATEQHGDRVDVELSDQFLHEFDDGVPVDFFQLRRADGSTALRSKSLGENDLPVATPSPRRPVFWNLATPTGRQGRAVAYAFSPPKEGDESAPRTPLTLVFASDRGELNETLLALAWVLIGGGAVLLSATVLIVPRVLRKELSPLDQLAEQAARIDAGSLSNRFPTEVPGEIKPISERLNLLLSRLEESFERERRFSADLAHELRTPIAELRSLAEVSLQWPDSGPAETNADVLAIALQMEGIVTRLLELLRSERGQLQLRLETVRLGEIIESVWLRFHRSAEEKRLQVIRNVPPAERIQTDPVLLRSILANLVSNAVEYTPPGGIIRLDVEVGGGQFTIRISNTAADLDATDLPRLFERFWRKDQARSDSQHCGLGLSLAHAFAQVLGGKLTASITADSLLALTLCGPA